jgi:hypothetical protein
MVSRKTALWISDFGYRDLLSVGFELELKPLRRDVALDSVARENLKLVDRKVRPCVPQLSRPRSSAVQAAIVISARPRDRAC